MIEKTKLTSLTISIASINTLRHFWGAIIDVAHALYENHGFSDVDQENQDYREAEILNQLQNIEKSDCDDRTVAAAFEFHTLEEIEMLIKHGENKAWELSLDDLPPCEAFYVHIMAYNAPADEENDNHCHIDSITLEGWHKLGQTPQEFACNHTNKKPHKVWLEHD